MLLDNAAITHPGQVLNPRDSLDFLLAEALASGGRGNITSVMLALNDPDLPVPGEGEAVDMVHPGSHAHTGGFWGRVLRHFGGGAS